MLKWTLIVVGGLVLLVALLALVGVFVPREHTATCRARFAASAEAVFAVLTDVEGLAQWRADVKSTHRVEPIAGKPAYVEESKHGAITYAVEGCEPPRKLVLRIADDALPYGGTWTFALAPQGDGCTLSITEDGFVKNVIFRTLARFVFGHHATMQSYIVALGQKFGEAVTVERVTERA